MLMSKYSNSNFSTLNIVAPLILIFYLCIGFIPNWGAVDKIAPQWLAMSIINLISFGYFFNNRKAYSNYLTNNIKSNLTLTYICFILWAIGSLFYAINPTEVVVNLARQINVFTMFFSMVILINGLKDKLRFFSWVITILIIIENYAVMNEALDMIRKAVNISPQSGYIIDSLAWGFYQLGRYTEAIEPMERAIELEPEDPIINDHLGDVLWKIGRKREAYFQWKKALLFNPTKELKIEIQKKISFGLE